MKKTLSLLLLFCFFNTIITAQENQIFSNNTISITPKGQPLSKETAIYPLYKNPGVSALYSLLIPGGGQFYNRQITKGFCLMGGFVLSSTLTIIGLYTFQANTDPYTYTTSTPTNTSLITIGYCGMLLTYLWSIIDAPIIANKQNKANGITFHFTPEVGIDRLTMNTPTAGAKLTISF